MNNVNPITVTVPLNSSVNFSVNTIMTIIQIGAGDVTLVEESSPTIILNTAIGLSTGGQYTLIQMIKVDTDTWDVIGGVL